MLEVCNSRTRTQPPTMYWPINSHQVERIMIVVSNNEFYTGGNTKMMQLAAKHPGVMEMEPRCCMLFRNVENNTQSSANFISPTLMKVVTMIVLCMNK